MPPPLRKLFVYGTLLPELKHPLILKNHKWITFIEKGEVQGALYDTGSYPAAVKEGKENIKGWVIELKDLHLINLFDQYEGFYPDSINKSEYTREIVKVRTAGEKPVECWIYWYLLPVESLHFIPEGDYLTYLMKNG